MKLLDNLKVIFSKNKQKKENQKIEEKPKEFKILLNDIDKCALYIENREPSFVLIKDKNFPFMLNEPDLEFIEMNKNNFEYYGEFYRLEVMNEKILKLERQEELEKKTENDYLVEYLLHSENEFSKIIEKMKSFEIDNTQYDKLIDTIKYQIKQSVKNLYENHTNSNPILETNRSYKKIKNHLIGFNKFTDKFSYKYYNQFRNNDESISHCGYPDYMWQAGVEGTYIHLSKIPNSINWVFEYNKCVGEQDEYITKFAIVSEKEKETILKHWNEIQYRNELQFEEDYMESLARRRQERKDDVETI